MFGIVKPCRHQLTPELRREWMGHLCGLCLTLRDHHGQATRITTNTDAVVLSALVDAQRPAGVQTTDAAPCPLRGFRTARVVAASEPAALHAAAVSLTMAATKVDDHVADRDGLAGRLPGAGRVGRRWAAQGDDLAQLVEFDTALLTSAVARSNAIEATGEPSFAVAVRPTADAAAAAFVHTAVLAGRPENIPALDTIGRCFGRIVYLLDAFEDADDDIAHGRFNVLAAATTDVHERRRIASALFRENQQALSDAFDSLALARPALARALLIDQVRAAGHRTLHVHHDERCEHRGRHVSSAVTGTAARGAERARRAGRQVLAAGHVVGGVSAAAVVALTGAAGVFRPENPQEPPFDPTQGQFSAGPFDPNQMPPQQPPPQQQQPQQSSFGEDLATDASDCCCDGCCCCACDSCCDGCDCCDCCDC